MRGFDLKKTSLSERGLLASIAWAVFFVVLLPNLLFLGLALFAGVGRDFVNLDYALPALFFVLGLRLPGVFLVFLLFLVDVFGVVGQVFPFIRMADIVYLAKFAFFSSAGYQIVALLVVFVVTAKAFVFFVFCSGRIDFKGFILVFNFLMCLYFLDAYFLAKSGGEAFWRTSHGGLASSQVTDFWKRRSGTFLEFTRMSGDPFSELSPDSAVASHWIGGGGGGALPNKVLLIINESWGVSSDPDIQSALLWPLRAVANGGIEVGQLPFVGGTMAAELRELCLLKPNHYNFIDVFEGFDSCIPARLKKDGYATASVHGAMSLMYDRKYWYPRVGFDENIFFESGSWSRRCYSFPGVCDVELMPRVQDFLSGDGKRFLYWLTLNTHAFYDLRDLGVDVFDCKNFSVSPDSNACRNLKLQAQFFYELGEMLKSDAVSGTAVLVVGDHEPPLTKSRDGEHVFESEKVPWVSFVVK